MRRSLTISLLVAGLAVFAGCFEQPGRQSSKQVSQAIDRAIGQLVSFSQSAGAALLARPSVVQLSEEDVQGLEGASLAQSKGIQQTIDRIANEQLKAFQASLDNLEARLRDAPPEAAGVSSAISAGYGLAAQVRTYQARWMIGKYMQAEGELVTQQDKAMQLAVEIRGLNRKLVKLQEHQLAGPIKEARTKVIPKLDEQKALAVEQLEQVDRAIDLLAGLLKDNTARREALDRKITDLTTGLSQLGPVEALEVQKKINSIEEKRFAISKTIDRLETGPYDLPSSQTIRLEGGEVTAINGLKHLTEEKQILTERVEHIDGAIESQQDYVKRAEDQIRVIGTRIAVTEKRIAQLAGELKSAIADVSDALTKSLDFAQKAETDLGKASRHAKAAQLANKKYFSAVRAAGKPGEPDEFLELAKKGMPGGLVFDQIAIEVMLTEAELMAKRTSQIEVLTAVLTLIDDQRIELTAELSKYLAGAQATAEALEAQIKQKVEKAIESGDAMLKRAARPADLKSVVSADLAGVYYRAASLLPDEAEALMDEARGLSEELLEANPDPNSEIGKSIFHLKRALGID